MAFAISGGMRAVSRRARRLFRSAITRGIGTHLAVDELGRTGVTGVWAAGNVADPMAQVGASAAAGATAGAQINADLVAEETRDAVALLRLAGQPTAKPTLRTSTGAIST